MIPGGAADWPDAPPPVSPGDALTATFILMRFCERFGAWPYEVIDRMTAGERAVAFAYERVRGWQESQL